MRIPEVLFNPLYWTVMLPTLFVSFLPYYIEKTYWNLIRFPHIRADNPYKEKSI